MPPQTRRLLELIERMVAQRCAEKKLERGDVLFRARQVREFTGWGSLQVHLHRLAELEYLLTHRADHGQGFVYELVYDGAGKDGGRFLPGLIDVEKLRAAHGYGEKLPGLATELSGVNGEHPAPIRPVSGPLPGPVRPLENGVSSSEKCEPHGPSAENAHLDGAGKDAAA